MFIFLQFYELSVFNKILTAFDGSETSDRALYYAAQLASISDGDLIILFVVHELIKEFSQKEDDISLEDKIQNLLNKNVNKIKKIYPNLKIRSIIMKGSPSFVIVEVAKKENVDLIVVGSRGFRIKDWSLGSISSSVVNHSPINVLVIK